MLAYCEMLHALAVQPRDSRTRAAEQVLYPVTTTQLNAGELSSGNYTAFINPGQTIPAGAGANQLQAFVNNGGRYVGDSAGGTTTARNAGFTNLNTSPTNTAPFNDPCLSPQPASLQTPGTLFTGEFDTDNPVAWGFDNGGFIYRQASNSPVYNPATLAGSAGPPAVPNTNVSISYADPLTAFGYTCNAIGPGELPGRPYATDSTFGAGHSTVLGSNPWYRSWVDVEWRMALNGALYPDWRVDSGRIRRGSSRRLPGRAARQERAAQGHRPTGDQGRAGSTRCPDRDRPRQGIGGRETPAQGERAEGRAPQGNVGPEGDDLVLVFRKAWKPDATVTPWVFRLGIVTKGSSFADTNIPGRSH